VSDATAGLIVIGLVGGAAVLGIFLAFVPGRIARERGHPSAEAIRICGVLGLVIWPLWIVAYIWAYTGPGRDQSECAPPRGLACDGCGGTLALSQARRIGARLFCSECAELLEGDPRGAPEDPADPYEITAPKAAPDSMPGRSRRERLS
jgi:hypothetical protein